jgi:hypothetical protein
LRPHLGLPQSVILDFESRVKFARIHANPDPVTQCGQWYTRCRLYAKNGRGITV